MGGCRFASSADWLGLLDSAVVGLPVLPPVWPGTVTAAITVNWHLGIT
jgi:hypothetical protein